MDNVAKNFNEAAVSAVLVADLVHAKQYAQAIRILHILAEKAEAAEAACFLPQILRNNPDYASQAVDILRLNLEQMRRRVYGSDAGYRHYVAILYQEAARGMAKVGFVAEAEQILQNLEKDDLGGVVSVSPVEAIVPTFITPVVDNEDVVEAQQVKEELIINQEIVADEPEIGSGAIEESVLVIEEGNEPLSVPDMMLSPVENVLEQEQPVLENLGAVEFDVSIEAQNLSEGAAEVELSEPAIPAVSVEIVAPVTVEPEVVESEVQSAPVDEVKEVAKETSVVENPLQDSNNEVNINKVLNLNSNEIDKHFEQIKQITAEAVKKAELQAEKLKQKVRRQKFSAISLSKIKEVAQQASQQSAQKVLAITPAMQKIKGLAGKFLKKKDQS